MKTRLVILVLLSVFSVQCKNRCKPVEGPRFSEYRPLGPANSLLLDMVADVMINADSTRPREIEIIAQENLHEKVLTDYDQGELTLSLDGCVKENEEILLKANVDSLYQITTRSAGSVSSSTLLKSDVFRLTNEGLGDLDFALWSNSIIAEIKSAGDIILVGSTQRFEFLTTASGDLRAFNLVADTVNLNIIGSSVCEVYTDGVLNINFYTSGVVNYRGNPKQLNVTGDGTVNERNL